MITWKELKAWWISEATGKGFWVASARDFYFNPEGRAIFDPQPAGEDVDPDDGLMFGTQNMINLAPHLVALQLETPSGGFVPGVGVLELNEEKTHANVYSGYGATKRSTGVL
jgi:hypothetical protein